MNAAPLELHDRIQRELEVVRPEGWTADDCLLVLGALTKISEGRRSDPA